VVSGGIACIAGVFLTAALLPGFVRHERTLDREGAAVLEPGTSG
jgi:hypothetical protein